MDSMNETDLDKCLSRITSLRIPMSFDNFISSSNTFADDKEDVGKKVKVKTDLPLVWTIDLKE